MQSDNHRLIAFFAYFPPIIGTIAALSDGWRREDVILVSLAIGAIPWLQGQATRLWLNVPHMLYVAAGAAMFAATGTIAAWAGETATVVSLLVAIAAVFDCALSLSDGEVPHQTRMRAVSWIAATCLGTAVLGLGGDAIVEAAVPLQLVLAGSLLLVNARRNASLIFMGSLGAFFVFLAVAIFWMTNFGGRLARETSLAATTILGSVGFVLLAFRSAKAPASAELFLRRAMSWGIGITLLGGAFVLCANAGILPTKPLKWVALGAAGALALIFIDGFAKRVSPYYGRHLAALRAVTRSASYQLDLEEFARSVLTPLTLGKSGGVEPVLYAVGTQQEVRLDIAGAARVRSALCGAAITARFADPGCVILDRFEIERGLTRNLELREAALALAALSALAAIALRHDGELEGVLIVPAMARVRPLSHEERHLATTLSTALGARLASIAALHRAQKRVEQSHIALGRMEDRLEELQANLRRLSALAEGTFVIYVGEPPKSTFIERHAGLNSPLYIEASTVETAVSAATQMPRSERDSSNHLAPTIVLIAREAVPVDEAAKIIFGEANSTPAARQGVLQLASHGTVVIASPENLAVEIQQQLAQALATQSYSPVGSPSSVGLQARLIFCSGGNRNHSLLSAELAERLTPFMFRVDTLAEPEEPR